MDALVAHYHEVGLKGRNRDFFEEALARNIRRALRGTGYTKMRRGFGRIMVDFEPDAPVADAAARAADVFGVAYVGAGRRVEPQIDAITAAAIELIEPGTFESFRVRCRRAHSSSELRSAEINTIVGQAIKDLSGARVDLGNAEATAWIELFAGTGIVYSRRFEGAGGLPAGTSGKMLALLSGGIDSPVAAWRMARRGADVEFVHFHGQPFSDPSSVRQAADLAQTLTRYQLQAVLHLVPLGDAQREIVTHCPANLRVILYRRMMMRIASKLAAQRDAIALVTGDSLGQVASQTIENITTVDAAISGIQILRPLVGMDKQEIVDLATRIGTYDISTRKHQDCCVLFEPRSPATRSTPLLADQAEAGVDVDVLADKALTGLETRMFELPELERPGVEPPTS
ncbi:MAG TPA: tRNA uracil 4-sulfurtransferase ThiI [Actinomycetota bacterium]|nr:tRNA uracil 4-sulfurtransferase ThiI [Actinomycetota bacterium]